VARVGVEEPHSGRLATAADADLPSLLYGHLVGDPRALLCADCSTALVGAPAGTTTLSAFPSSLLDWC
jgi:hypothetical protein